MQDSSVRNDFNEYREILQSHTENYSDDDFVSSAIESLNVSNEKVRVQQAIAEEIVNEDRATPIIEYASRLSGSTGHEGT